MVRGLKIQDRSFDNSFTGYNKNAPPCGVKGYTGPLELGGAINAPLDAQGHDTYLGY